MPSPDEINAFVAQVVKWTQLLQDCADTALVQARKEYERTGDFGRYTQALGKKLEVTQHCAAITASASTVLLKVAEGSLGSIQTATTKLEEASKKIDKVDSAVGFASELVVAAGALAAALAAPSPATIAAAAAAIYAVAEDVLKDGVAGN